VLVLGACVTIEGVAQLTGTVACPDTLPNGGVVVPPQETARTRSVVLPTNALDGAKKDIVPEHFQPPTKPPMGPEPARTSHSLGPVLRFGDHTGSPIEGSTAFLQISCDSKGIGETIRGFRLYGPTFEDQQNNNYAGIRIENCTEAEIANMEVAGWGGSAIEVRFLQRDSIPTSWPDALWVRIHDNYLHHNLHTSDPNDHSAGYGVTTGDKAFSLSYQNVLDYNNHDLTASGKAGGYIAQQNLVLKGGGVHSTGLFGFYMHVFDVHGDQKDCPLSGAYTCGNAPPFYMVENTFQYKNSDDIGIRGKVRRDSFIQQNVFARSSERAAIDLFDDAGIYVDHNSYDVDTYGQYAICDFDGDGVDDLLLTTGVTWWFSSAGQFPWTFLRADRNLADAVALGDFDGDHRCDALEEPTQKGVWYIARSGASQLEPLAKDAFGHAVNFGHPLNEVRFGRFDPSSRDHRIGVIRTMTHAFWRSPQGQWFVTPLNKVDWQYIGGSSFPLSDLRFGDFDGDGVTDVLAVVSGHWAFSSAGREPWKRLNQTLSEPVAPLIILNMDTDDNIDDLLKLESHTVPLDPSHPLTSWFRTTITWWRSRNGSEPWVAWKHYEYTCDPHDPNVAQPCGTSYAGRFAAIPGNRAKPVDPKRAGAGVLAIDPWRVGHFYNPGESVNGRPKEWTSDSAQFRY